MTAGAVPGDLARGVVNQLSAGATLLGGVPGFFVPRLPVVWLHAPGSAEATSYYDTAPLRSTLERLIDFDRINSGAMRFSVGAVNVSSATSSTSTARPTRSVRSTVMASGALPRGFPAIEVEGEFYWDGGLVSNTPLQWVLESDPPRDTLAFQVDLWSARGSVPRTMTECHDPSEGNPVLEPHAQQHRPVQVHAETAKRRREPAGQSPGRSAEQPEVAVLAPRAPPQCLQPRPSHLPGQAVRGRLEGLRVLAPEHGGPLARRLLRHGTHHCDIRRCSLGRTTSRAS